MHSSRMRTVRSSSRLSGVGASASLHAGIPTPPPGTRPSWDQAPLPGTRHPPVDRHTPVKANLRNFVADGKNVLFF